jgi:hypothetical protein
MKKLTADQIKFLCDLVQCGGVASPRNIGPQMSQAQNSARQRCKRNGLVIFEKGYWLLTNKGREAFNYWAGD